MEEDLKFLDFPTTKLVALYDYSYRDDDGNVVTMTQGEEYCLIEKYNDWWEVIRDAGDVNDVSFFVPANYVRVVGAVTDSNLPNLDTSVDTSGSEENYLNSSDDDNNRENSTSSSAAAKPGKYASNKSGSKDVSKTSDGKMEENDYENSPINSKGLHFERKTSTSTFTSGFGNFAGRELDVKKSDNFRRSFSDEGEYVNLDRYRAEAGLGSERRDSSETTEDMYANLQDLHQDQPPPAEPIEPLPPMKGNHLKTLLGVWDMYLDPHSNRIFYINKESQERTWKPPRHPDKSKQVVQKAEKMVPISKRPSVPDVKILDNSIPSGWRVELSGTKTYFVNMATNEKWGTSHNIDGKQYFYRIGGTETLWQLPEIDSKPNGEMLTAPAPTFQRDKSPGSSPQVQRSVKARSMIIGNKINFSQPSFQFGQQAIPPKSLTLPANMTSALTENVSPEPKSATLTHQPQESLSATINKAKIMEGGKHRNKKWSQSFVKLTGSNLVFYKDQRAAKSVPGASTGRPDFIVPLPGGIVEKNPKDTSSKKNLIKLTTYHNDQYLLQLDDEVMLQNWFIQLEMAISSLSHSNVQEPKHSTPVEDESKPLKRNNSWRPLKQRNPSTSKDDGSTLERKKKLAFLFNFMSKRPSKESLEQKGIIKDAVFGSHLKQLCDREKTKIPKFVQRCVAAIEKRGLDHDGIYRISGNMAQIQKLRCQVDQEVLFDLPEEDSYNLDDDDTWDVHVLTGSLKLFFRELKEPLFTYTLFDKFIPALAKEKNVDRLKAVRELINTLPKYNYETMKVLFTHLLRVIDNSKENRMQVHNIAIVFGPTLIWPEKETPNLAANMIYQSRIVEYCLLEYKNIFR